MFNNDSVHEILHQTALKAPSSSGVYLWRNLRGDVIYVGKAKNLKNRLASYFSGSKDVKTRLLVSHANSIEYITTANEYEAFLLENNLIKKYAPRYNIDLKDGKSYPVLRITNEEFPRLFKTRSVVRDGSLYFGPYPNAGALDSFIDTLYRIYPLRHCKSFRRRKSPCLYYHLGQCKAPCCGKIAGASYNEFFGEIAALLEGKGDETVRKLTAEMKAAASALNFEKAARLRDGLRALSVMQNQNVVESFDNEDRDYIAHHREGELVSFTVLKIRGGKMLGRDNFRVTSLNDDDGLTGEFMNAYYTSPEEIPPHIYVPTQGGLEYLRRWISEAFGLAADVALVSDEMEGAPRHKAAMNMAFENAREDIIRRLRERGDIPALQELQEILHLERLPVRIEGFDIAHIGGKFPVASLVSFFNGNPDKKNYRYFRLRTTDGIIDDFQSMREAVGRRYTRLLNEQEELPDLILIDGGIGQVNAVEGVLKALGLDIPVAGLAKRDEEIFRPGCGRPIYLPKRSDALRLLQRVRDETHRFATSRNQRLRTKENVASLFSELPGVGEKRARILMKAFSTIEGLSSADESEVAQAIRVRKEEAEKIIMSARALALERRKVQEEMRKSLCAQGRPEPHSSGASHIEDLTSLALSAGALPE